MYFKDPELVCKCGCGILKLHRGFRDELERLRIAFKRPMVITSACRCKKHNEAVGGHPNSLHVGDVPAHPGQTGALAVDVETLAGDFRGELFRLAWERGWSIGWGGKRRFLHLDRRDFVGLPQNSFDY